MSAQANMLGHMRQLYIKTMSRCACTLHDGGVIPDPWSLCQITSSILYEIRQGNPGWWGGAYGVLGGSGAVACLLSSMAEQSLIVPHPDSDLIRLTPKGRWYAGAGLVVLRDNLSFTSSPLPHAGPCTDACWRETP